ncbi:tyrosine decarboxylase MfnA [Roseateles sp. BYS180W]|uniref:Tyrosine decarboxylase MfnA n=1 Tax=Roseateles rivi TaxID=3299028 RepID=A0ABW7FTY4_9BURK
MRERGLSAAQLAQQQAQLLGQDRPWSRVFNSICTQPHPLALEAAMQTLHTNLGDVRIFAGTAQMAQQVTQRLGALMQGPHSRGLLVSGGTEANLLALHVARLRRPDITQGEVIAGETVHFSLRKACTLLGLRLRTAALDERLRLRAAAVQALITPQTLAIVGTAGSSEFGAVDALDELSALALQQGLHLHVDAATGGFIIPFARALGHALPPCDFSLEGVSSITLDPHKYGLSIIPSGALLLRDDSLPAGLQQDSFFARTPTHHSLLGTRSGAAAAATLAVLDGLGFEGYVAQTRANYARTAYLVQGLRAHGYALMLAPELNIVCVALPQAEALAQALEQRGWIISVSTRYQHALRLVVQRHVDEAMIDAFLHDLHALAPP